MKSEKRDPRIEIDRDFIISKKYENSLSKLLMDYPDGVPDRIICKVLQITPEELEKHYSCALINLKNSVL